MSYASTVLLIGAGLLVSLTGSQGGGDSSFFERTSYTKEYDSSLKELYAVLDVGDADLTIRDATPDLVYARFAEFTRKPETNTEFEGDKARVLLKHRSGRGINSFIHVDTDEVDDWTVKFCELLPLTLECTGDKADLHLNLATTPLRKLKLEAVDSEAYIKIGDLVPDVELGLFGDASKIRLRVPREAALKVKGNDYDAYLKQLGLIKKDGLFETDGFDTSSYRITVDLDERLKSLSIDTY